MPCEQKVRVWSDDKGVETFYKLLCSGVCKAGDAECANSPKPRVEGSGKDLYDIEFCRCNGGKGEEDPNCHVVLRTHRSDGKKSVGCDGECKNNQTEECKPVPGAKSDCPIPNKNGEYTGKMGSYVDYKCECSPKAKPK
jgi:hypothetical protein